MIRTLFAHFMFLFLMTSCHPNSMILEPTICYEPQRRQIEDLPKVFENLSPEERSQDWGKELLIANQFAHEFDLYRAITCYKRALYLLPLERSKRKLEIQFHLIQCYYLGQKYQDVIETFETSDLITVPVSFPATGDLLIILYDSYQKTLQDEKAEKILGLIRKYNPEVSQDLEISKAIEEGNLEEVEQLTPTYRKPILLNEFLCNYRSQSKSVRKAQLLNAILPGAGYYYVGQKKSALTSFIINTLFIAAAYQFFEHGHIAAGLITTSLETGWYFGGINGAGLEAKAWNQMIYENQAKEFMIKHRLFPALKLEISF